MTGAPKVWLLPNGNVVTTFEHPRRGRRFVQWHQIGHNGPEPRFGGSERKSLPEGAQPMIVDPAGHASAERLGNGKLWLSSGSGAAEWDADVDVEAARRLLGDAQLAMYVAADRLAAVRAGLEFLEAEEATRDMEEEFDRQQAEAARELRSGGQIRTMTDPYEVARQKRESEAARPGCVAPHTGPDCSPECEATEPVVTPESLEAHADWMDGHWGMDEPRHWLPSAEMRDAAKMLRVESESAEARKRVLADLQPGVYLVCPVPVEGTFAYAVEAARAATVAVVTPDGRFLVRQFDDGSLDDQTADYALDQQGYKFMALHFGDLSPVVTE